MTGIQTVSDIFKRWFQAQRAIGLSYAVILPDGTRRSFSIGKADLQQQRPVSDTTRFRIASMTKSFCAAALLILRDEGYLSLDQELTELLRSSDLHPSLRTVTLKQLLSMQSGLTTDDPWADRALGWSDDEYDALLPLEPFLPRIDPHRYRYSNYGYFLAGKVLARTAKMSVHRFIEERLLLPLGMKRSFWNLDASSEHEAAIGYSRVDEALVPQPSTACRGYGDVFAGLWSTSADILTWIDFLNSAYGNISPKYDAILSPASRREMQTALVPRPVADPELPGQPRRYGTYCLGIHRLSCGPIWAAGHSGGLPGFGSQMCWSNEHQVGIAVCANHTYASVYDTAYEALEAVIADYEPVQLTIPPLLERRATELLSLIKAWSSGTADTLFSENVYLDTPKPLLERRLRALKVHENSIEVRYVRGNIVGLYSGKEKLLTLSVQPLAPNKIQELNFTTS